MNAIANHLTADHKRCDDFFIEAENCVDSIAWAQAATVFAQFRDALESHFSMEEKVLFPAFENATGNSNGPTDVMRSEHRQIRGIISGLSDAIARCDKNAYLGHSESLNIMMQQHNFKEENILYPMTDRVLSAQKHDLIGEMNRLAPVA
ncbi:MAG: hemerythrin domain-containing protein [Burkholderiales bacterium]